MATRKFTCADAQEALAVLRFGFKTLPRIHVSSFGNGTYNVSILEGHMTSRDVLCEFEEAQACSY